jgi:DNA-binding MarR family transcriptional regulator
MTSQSDDPIEIIVRECIAVRVRLLNRVITSLYDDALRPLGLKVSQLNILVAAAKLGLARPAAVCEILQLDASTLSRNVEKMRRNGWIETVADEDARMQPFRLTAKGRRLLDRAVPAWSQAQQTATELLGENGAKELAKTAGRLGMQAK